MVSVDWDFFFYNAGEAGHNVTVFPGTDKEHEVAGMWLFDWGHNEGRAGALQTSMWYQRYSTFKNNGVDPVTQTGILKEKGCTDPKVFGHEIGQRFNFGEDPPLWFADSHALGYPSGKEAADLAESPIHIVHFDAHADLGYDEEKVFKAEKEGRADCADWAWHLIRQGTATSIDVVYPDWKGKIEWDELKKKKHIKQIKDKVRAFTWSEWLKEIRPDPVANGTVFLVNVARSGSWVPPWMDEKFDKELLKAVCYGDQECLDCTFDQNIGAFDACTPREFSVKQADETAAASLKMFEDLKGKK